MKVVFLGSSSYSLPIISVLKDNFTLETVITTEKGENDPVIAFCRSNQIEVESVSSKEELGKKIKELEAELAIVADFRLILSKEILKAFKYGVINIHPSLLPKYRGPTPAQAAILNGDEKTGITIIRLDEEVDHGPILASKDDVIDHADTADTIYKRLFKKGSEILEETIDKYIKGEINITEQDDKKASFTKKLTRNDGYFDLTNPPDDLSKMIRAFYPWPTAWSYFKVNGKKLRIKFLPGKKVQVEGKKEVSFRDFENGYPNAKDVLKVMEKINA